MSENRTCTFRKHATTRRLVR